MLIRNTPAQYLHPAHDGQHGQHPLMSPSTNHLTPVIPLDILQEPYDSSVRAEAMGSSTEGRFVDTFQYHAHHLLHQLVIKGRNTKRTRLPFALGYTFFWQVSADN